MSFPKCIYTWGDVFISNENINDSVYFQLFRPTMQSAKKKIRRIRFRSIVVFKYHQLIWLNACFLTMSYTHSNTHIWNEFDGFASENSLHLTVSPIESIIHMENVRDSSQCKNQSMLELSVNHSVCFIISHSVCFWMHLNAFNCVCQCVPFVIIFSVEKMWKCLVWSLIHRQMTKYYFSNNKLNDAFVSGV